MKRMVIKHSNCQSLARLQGTEIIYDNTCKEIQYFSCSQCKETMLVQVQQCQNCQTECVTSDPKNGRYTCWKCHSVQSRSPWTPPGSKGKKRRNVWWELFKGLGSKKPKLVHVPSYKCTDCETDTIWLDTSATSGVATCSLCGKEFKVSLS